MMWPASSRASKEAALTRQKGGGIGCDFSHCGHVVQRRVRRTRTFQLHECAGRYVPNHHECRIEAWRDFGHAAMQPSGYRGLHRHQARARQATHVQSLGFCH